MDWQEILQATATLFFIMDPICLKNGVSKLNSVIASNY